MQSTVSVPRIALVTGDVTLDWNIAHGANSSVWRTDQLCHACGQPGGAALLADLLEASVPDTSANGAAGWQVYRSWPASNDANVHHSYALWTTYPYAIGPRASSEKPAWRLQQYLGLKLASGTAAVASESDQGTEAGLVVINDATLGFRDRPELWPATLRAPNAPRWYLLKMARPVVRGPLWDRLVGLRSPRVVVVTTVNDLRSSDVQISHSLSWEQTAQDVLRELLYNPEVNALAACAHVVVSFGAAGALLLSNRNGRLFFDSHTMEDTWGVQYPGEMMGYTSCLTVAIARELMLAPDSPNLGRGIQNGVAALRYLHREGFGERGALPGQAHFGFPVARVAGVFGRTPDPLTEVMVPDPTDNRGSNGVWTILEQCSSENLDALAEQIVRRGEDAALADIPLARFGQLTTADRREIEGYRAIEARIRDYCQRDNPVRPLSIAVFGPPGSGKSFAITQIAETVVPGRIRVLEFNLSQRSEPAALLDALHQVRDAGLAGKIPLAFWDEFDTTVNGQELTWLRYFLAPMWDGRFLHGQITHLIGRAIFVFAGSTCATMDLFGKSVDSHTWITAKGDDFVSRLSGYVNVLGPNRLDTAAAPDRFFVLRRAIILRSVLLRRAPWLFRENTGSKELEIDAGVLRALLHTQTYRHGARSLEAVISMSSLEGRSRFDRSCLPPDAQLGLHVAATDFAGRVHQLTLEGETLERLAQAAHAHFCEQRTAEGMRPGHSTDEQAKTHSSLVPYSELSAHEKEQNRSLVRDIPAKLASIGYTLTAARGVEPPVDLDDDLLERLADAEHDRWMKTKIAAGWRYAEPTDKANSRHQDIVLWERWSKEELQARYTQDELDAMGPGLLSEAARKKDRELIAAIPDLVARAGFVLVKVRA